MRRLLGVLIALLFTGFITNTFGQGFSNFNWYFGDDNKGVIFQKSDTSSLDIIGIQPLGLGSSAIAVDPYSGEVLFYTDGVNIFNYDDDDMAPDGLLMGAGLANPVLNQTVAICVNPQFNNQYYVFTRRNDGTVVYAIIDMTEDNVFLGRAPLGAVTSTDNTIASFTNTSHAIKVIPNLAKDGFLLIAHQSTTGDYLVLPVTNTGLGTPFTVTTIGTAISNTIGSISYDAVNNRIAVTSTVNGESAEIIDIFAGPATSTIVPNTSFPGEVNFDTQWSANGDYLYISRNGGSGTGDILQYDVVNDITTLNIIGIPVTESFGIQMAPDSAIYHLYEEAGQTLVGRLINPELDATQVTYESDVFSGQTFNAEQFPATLPDYRVDFAITITPVETCLNAPTIFNAELTNINTGEVLSIDQAFWDFDGDGMPDSNRLVPIFTYTDNSNLTPTIGVVAISGGQPYTGSQVINITDFDVQVSGVMDSVICPSQLPLFMEATAQSTSGANPVIKWGHEADVGASTSFTEAGEYYVTATVGNCVAYQTMTLTVYDQGTVVTPTDPIPEYWYFGDRAGLEFLGGAVNAVPLTSINQISTEEGCSIYTNAQGDVLFYTDGVTVYDRNGDIIGSDIGGDQNATQSALIVPTSDETIFYIFTTQEVFDTSGNSVYECRYSVFDLKLNNGIGDMLIANKHLFNASTERIASDGNWIIAHEYGTNSFKAFQLLADGVSAPVISDVSTSHDRTLDITGHGQMKLSVSDPVTGNARLTLALSLSSSENYIEVFDFDAQTGLVSNPMQLDFEANTGQAYGVEFSPSGNILYASLNDGANSQIFRWEIDTTTVVGYETDMTHVENSFDEVVPAQGVEFGALQIGPNGQIYVAVNNSTSIGSFQSPDAAFTQGTAPNFTYLWSLANFSISTDLAGQQSKLGLPSSDVDSQGSGIAGSIIPPSSVCLGDITTFNGSGIWQSDQLIWNVSTPSSPRFSQVETGSPFDYTTTEPGIHTVQLIMRHQNPCLGDEVVGEVQFEVYTTLIANPANEVRPNSCQSNDGAFTIQITSPDTYTISVTGQPDRIGLTAGDHDYTGLSSGTYSVTITNEDPNSCSDSFVIPLIPVNSAFDVIATPQKADCDGTNGGVLYDIVDTTPPNPPGVTVPFTPVLINTATGTRTNQTSTSNLSANDISPIDVGVYVVEITDNVGCTEQSPEVTVVSYPLVELDIEPSHIVCEETIDIPFTTTGSITVSTTADPVGLENGVLTVSASGVYLVTATDPNDPNTCPNEIPVSVIFFNKTPSPLADSYVICPKEAAGDLKERTLDPGSEFRMAIWYYEDGVTPIDAGDANYTIVGNTITVKASGNIVGEFENFFGCIATQPISIIEECIARIVPPNVFRPASGVNDNQNFSIFSIFLDPNQFEIFIYNRWGELMFHSEELDFKWNGGYNNDLSRPVPLGTYAYVLKYVDVNDESQAQQEQRGGVLLIK